MPGRVLGIDGTAMNETCLFFGLRSNGGRQTINECTTKAMSGGDKCYKGKFSRKKDKKVTVAEGCYFR